ncbi:MAG: helix-hairpin-helix domain-containing protein [Lachnospiraceae bacterium]|nr:helix-hairpin-helix domain-containing protein [Lachnospiraceae bacterium]
MKIKNVVLITILSLSLSACAKDGLTLSEFSENNQQNTTEYSETQNAPDEGVSFSDAENLGIETDKEKEGEEKRQRAGYVHICGAVQNPGIYEFCEGDRLFEILDKAGGYDEEADMDAVNIAVEAKDGMQVRIPYIGENLNFGENKLIDLNKASIEELCTIPGIGESRAKAIIEYRESKGGFSDIEELKEISGIKNATFDKIKPYVCLN